MFVATVVHVLPASPSIDVDPKYTSTTVSVARSASQRAGPRIPGWSPVLSAPSTRCQRAAGLVAFALAARRHQRASVAQSRAGCIPAQMRGVVI